MDAKNIKTEPELTIPITPKLIRRVRAHIAGKGNAGKTSPARRAASRENGKKGGRPRRPQMELKLT